MNSIQFITPGILDDRAFTIFGLSAKETSNPVGKFGTGLKYAIAICLRHGLTVNLTTSTLEESSTRYFSSHTAFMRNTQYQEIFLTDLHGIDIPLPFTTQLGQNWSLWQAIRELHANTKDEKGWISFEAGEDLDVEPNYTIIEISGDSPELSDIIDRWQYFFPDLDPADLLHSHNNIDIYQSANPGAVYRQGYLVYQIPDAVYSYNVHMDLLLTEDRTVSAPENLKRNIGVALYSISWEFDLAILSDDNLFEHHYLSDYLDALYSKLDRNWDRLTTSLRDTITSHLRAKKEVEGYEVEGTDEQLANLDLAAAFFRKIYPKLDEDNSEPITFILGNKTQYDYTSSTFYVSPRSSTPLLLAEMLEEITWANRTQLVQYIAAYICDTHAAAVTAPPGNHTVINLTGTASNLDAATVAQEIGELMGIDFGLKDYSALVIATATGSHTVDLRDTVPSEIRGKSGTNQRPNLTICDEVLDEDEFDLPPSERTGKLDPELTKDDFDEDWEDPREFYSDTRSDTHPDDYPGKFDSSEPDERNTPEPDYSFKE